jgi:hypothetical protein
MVYRSDVKCEEIIGSGVATEDLVAQALSRPTVEMLSELYGRTHAFYALGHTLPAAVAFMATVTSDSERRRMAARALAMAGYEVSDLSSLAAQA